MIATLTATIIVPAKAGTSGEPLLQPTPAVVAPGFVPALLYPHGEAILSDSQAADGVDSEDAASVKPAADLASMVAHMRGPDSGSRELDCLATGIYFESKSEPLAGQLAVGRVIANRAQSGGRFPGTYCGVLFQRSQFSFIRGHSLPSVPRSSKQWQTAVALAQIVDQGLKDSAVGNALFFHARYVSPGWRLKRVASIGNHIFYR